MRDWCRYLAASGHSYADSALAAACGGHARRDVGKAELCVRVAGREARARGGNGV